MTPQTPVFFILSAGVDPVKDTEKLGKVLGFGFDQGNFGLVSLGQGQEPVAERAIETSYKNGGYYQFDFLMFLNYYLHQYFMYALSP